MKYKMCMPMLNLHLLKNSKFTVLAACLYLRAYITKHFHNYIDCSLSGLWSMYHCSRPSAVGCSLGCLLRQGVFPLIGQHAADLPVPQCVHTLLPGGSVCDLYSLAPGSWRCAEVRPPHIPHDQSLPEERNSFLLIIDYTLNDDVIEWWELINVF